MVSTIQRRERAVSSCLWSCRAQVEQGSPSTLSSHALYPRASRFEDQESQLHPETSEARRWQQSNSRCHERATVRTREHDVPVWKAIISVRAEIAASGGGY